MTKLYYHNTELRKTLSQLQEALTINRYSKALASHESAVSKGASTFFRKQGIAFGSALADHWGISEVTPRQLNFLGQLFDDHVDTPIDFITKAIKNSFVAGMLFGNQEYNLGISFTVKNPRAVEYIDIRGLALLKELNTTTKDDIRKIVSAGLDNGDSYSAIARAIKSKFVQYATKTVGSKSRAEVVAITEAGKAYQAGNFGAIQEATSTGLKFQKSWLPVSDPCPICQTNADQGWIDLDAKHSSGDDHPVAHPICRCAELYQRVKT